MLTYLSYVKGWKLRCQVDTEIVRISSSMDNEKKMKYLWSTIGGYYYDNLWAIIYSSLGR